MTAVKQSTVTQPPQPNNDRKPRSSKTFEDSETDRESYGSSSDDMESYSPKSVGSRMRRWQASVKNVKSDVFGRRVRSQIERIRAEDSHLGEDIGECSFVKICGSGHDEDVSRPASPLSGKAAASAT